MYQYHRFQRDQSHCHQVNTETFSWTYLRGGKESQALTKSKKKPSAKTNL